jgi:predicted GNAT family acetyltransferase
MTPRDPADTVRDNRASHRFELTVGAHTAFLQYRLTPGEMALIHTEVPPSLRGRGVGNVLAQAALEAAGHGGLRVRALCPFVQAYVRKHPKFQRLVAEDPKAPVRPEELDRPD